MENNKTLELMSNRNKIIKEKYKELQNLEAYINDYKRILLIIEESSSNFYLTTNTTSIVAINSKNKEPISAGNLINNLIYDYLIKDLKQNLSLVMERIEEEIELMTKKLYLEE